MPINQYFKPAEFTPLDPTFLLKAKALNDEKAEKANTEFDSIFAEINKVKAVPSDIPLRNEKLKGYFDQLKLWTDKYANNPSQGLKELLGVKRNFNQEFYYGQLGDIHKKGLQLEERTKDYNERAGKGDFAGLEDIAYHAMIEAPLMGYEQSTEIKPGVYNSINWGQPGKYSDLGEDFGKFAQQWAASSKYGELKRDRFGYLSSVTNDYVDPKEVYDGIMQYAYADPKYRRQLEDMAKYYKFQTDKYTNVTPEGIPFVEGSDESGNPVYMKPPTGADSVREYIGGMADAIAAREGFQKLSKDYREDWMLKKAMEDEDKKEEQPQYQSYNLPSVMLPTDSKFKVPKVKNVPGETRSLTKEETEQIRRKYSTVGSNGELIAPVGKKAEAMYAELSQKVYIPADQKVTYSQEQEVIYQKAKNKYGKDAKTDAEKSKMINQYIDEFEEQITYPGILTYNYAHKPTAELAERENKMFTEGTGQLNVRDFKLMAGEGEESLTGQEFESLYGSANTAKSEYTKYISGKLNPDNPYYPAGRIVTVLDKKGKEVGRYAMSGSIEEVNDPKSRAIFEMAQARLNAAGTSEIYLPIRDQNTGELKMTRMNVFYDKGIKNIQGRNVEAETVTISNPNDPNNSFTLTQPLGEGSIFTNTFDAITKQR
jgi:hypothetical protein